MRWWETAVVYQLYVRSFADSDGDGIGDLNGIRSRLDYIKALGVDAIWLNPCYPSPQLDHGYDVSDYFDIEPDYGTLADFDALVAACRERDLRVVMDVVPNHCSTAHTWFSEAVAAGRGSTERDRFWFREGAGSNGDEPPNDWQAMFGGSAWTRVTEPDGSPGQWYLGVFTPHQPDLNWNSAEVVEHFDAMLRFWFDRGVDGFRVDAVQSIDDKHFEFPHAQRAKGRPNEHPVWTRWRTLLNEYEAEHPDRSLFLVAEVWSDGHPEVMSQFVNDREFHAGFAFDLLQTRWQAAAMQRAIDNDFNAVTRAGGTPAWTLNNHDVVRSVTRYGRPDATEVMHRLVQFVEPVPDLELGARRARAALLVQLALPGTAYLYAGEELGLPEVLDLPPEARTDPVFAGTNGVLPGRDGCRIPLPWTTDPVAKSWLPVPADWGSYAVSEQETDPESMLAFYRATVAARREMFAGAGSEIEWLETGDDDLLAFRRDNVAVVLNTSPHELPLPDVLHAGDVTSIACDTAQWLRLEGRD